MPYMKVGSGCEQCCLCVVNILFLLKKYPAMEKMGSQKLQFN